MKLSLTAKHSARVLLRRPLLAARVNAGFPSPAEDWVEGRLDLNEHLIIHPNATYYVRVTGDSMSDELRDGDLLVVDRACEPKNGDIVIARVADEFTVKRLCTTNGHAQLVPANQAYRSLEITEESDFEVWGKVLWSIRRH